MSQKARKAQAEKAYRKAGVMFEFDGSNLWGLLPPGKLTETDSHGFNLGPSENWPSMPEFWFDAIEKLNDMQPFKDCDCLECAADGEKLKEVQKALAGDEWIRIQDGRYSGGFADPDAINFVLNVGEAESFDNQGVPFIRKV